MKAVTSGTKGAVLDAEYKQNDKKWAKINALSFVMILLGTAAFSFIAGRITRQHFFSNISFDASFPTVHPSLSMHDGKVHPKHKYSGVHFDASKTDGKLVNPQLPSVFNYSGELCIESGDGEKQCVIDKTGAAKPAQTIVEDGGDDNEEEHITGDHFPAGQHLLIDINYVDSDFLNSDVRLANAMIEVVNLSNLTLLSYHCHNLIPQGVSCVGVLLESHISFHTWPEAGVITIDLFMCGSGKLLPLVPIIESLFAIPQVGSLLKPVSKRIHKLRGFRSEDYDDVLVKDLGIMLADSSIYYKDEIATVQTEFQRIDVFDIHDKIKNLTPDKKVYMEENPAFFRPSRTVYLDGVIQSTSNDMEAYHEALVHPAMYAHPDPRKVAIIGGGEGATLKEVLKHSTLEKVQMIEIDEKMVSSSKKFIPKWSDCSDIVGSEEWCGDDPRADLFYEDALAWFIDRYSENGKLADKEHEKFDVIIMDALDPQDDIPFAELLYTDETFISSLYNALNHNGIITFQLGEAPDISNHHDSMNENSRRAILTEKLEDAGFESFHLYEDGNCGFWYPWTFLTVMKDSSDSTAWYRNQAELDVAIHKRTLKSKSGKPSLAYFDGAMMTAYQMPHKVFQSVFCRQDPIPAECYLERRTAEDVPESDLEVKNSSIGDGSGRGVFTTVDMKKGMTIGKESTVNPVYFSPSSTALILQYEEEGFGEMTDVYNYMDGYGWESQLMGGISYYVDSSLQTFINHGCNGTYNVGPAIAGKDRSKLDQKVTEQNATEDDFETYSTEGDWTAFSPYRLRHLHAYSTTPETALVDIYAREELFTDYLDFTEEENWWDEVLELRKICNGEAVGFITKTEQNHLEREIEG